MGRAGNARIVDSNTIEPIDEDMLEDIKISDSIIDLDHTKILDSNEIDISFELDKNQKKIDLLEKILKNKTDNYDVEAQKKELPLKGMKETKKPLITLANNMHNKSIRVINERIKELKKEQDRLREKLKEENV